MALNVAPKWPISEPGWRTLTRAPKLPLRHSVAKWSRPLIGSCKNLRPPKTAAAVAARRPNAINATPRAVALSIAAKASAFDWPALRKKSRGGNAGGTYPKIRVAPSTPTASSHPVLSPSMISAWPFRIFLPTSASGLGNREIMLPSRSAIRIEEVGDSPLSFRCSESHRRSRPAKTTPARWLLGSSNFNAKWIMR